jgi:hypothetical protein
MLMRFHDTELDLPCTPKEGQGGKLRCFPDIAFEYDVYVDPRCYTKGSLIQSTQLEPRFVAHYTTFFPGYDIIPPLYELGEEVSEAWQLVGQECQPYPLGERNRAYQKGNRVPHETFVELWYE